MWSMSFTSVVRARSVVVVIRFDISCGDRPWKFQTMLMTGMSMSGKMSVGVRKITMGLRMSNTKAITMNVYGRRRARATIHIGQYTGRKTELAKRYQADCFVR